MCGIVSAAHADTAVDGQGGTLREGQGSVGNPVAASAEQGCGSICIERLIFIERNEQYNACGNGIAAAQGTVADQCHLGDAVGGGIGGCIVKVLINLPAHFEQSHAHRREPGSNCGVILHVKGSGRLGGDVLLASHIVPAHKLIAARGGGDNRIALCGAPGNGGLLRDSSSIHGVAAVFGGQEGGGSGHIGNQLHVSHGDRGSRGAAGLHIDIYRGAGCQLLGKGAVCGDCCAVHLNGARIESHSIVKRKCGCNCLVIGNGQGCIMIGIAARAGFLFCRAVNGCSACRPAGICFISRSIAYSDVTVTQSFQICCSCFCRKSRQRNGRHYRQNQQCRQHQRGKAFHYSFEHTFISLFFYFLIAVHSICSPQDRRKSKPRGVRDGKCPPNAPNNGRIPL